MAKTIGNPISWGLQHLGAAGDHLAEAASEVGGDTVTTAPQIQTLTNADIRDALRAGVTDFAATRGDAIFAVVIYPLAGLVLAAVGLHLNLLPLLFPMLAGFALLGPVAAVGSYDISRRREMGEQANWLQAFGFLSSPSFGAIFVLGLYLAGLFVLWMLVARGIYAATLGPETPDSLAAFLNDVFLTTAGWELIVFGLSIGFVFALGALAISVVSFPLLLDRHVGVPVAIATSIDVFRQNPRVILTWGGIVAAGLVVGSIPVLLGLIFVLPVLGHATWHLYRRAVT